MEAVVILIVPIVALFVGAAAVLQPRRLDPAAERVRIAERVAWLEERMRHAQAGNWDEQMMERLTDELADARHQQRALQVG